MPRPNPTRTVPFEANVAANLVLLAMTAVVAIGRWT